MRIIIHKSWAHQDSAHVHIACHCYSVHFVSARQSSRTTVEPVSPVTIYPGRQINLTLRPPFPQT